jgi:hypothetical protein
MKPPLQPPKGWHFVETGGGCTAFTRTVALASPRSQSLDDTYWLITEGEGAAPTDPLKPCLLTLTGDNINEIWWECSCLAEAMCIAEGARTP